MGNAYQSELKRWDVLAGIIEANDIKHIVDVAPYDGRVAAAVSSAVPDVRFTFSDVDYNDKDVHARFKENTEKCKGALRGDPIDLVYLEATRPDDVYEQIGDWYPKLRDGGMMAIGNFKHQEGIPVMRAVAELFPLYAVSVLPDNIAIVIKGAE